MIAAIYARRSLPMTTRWPCIVVAILALAGCATTRTTSWSLWVGQPTAQDDVWGFFTQAACEQSVREIAGLSGPSHSVRLTTDVATGSPLWFGRYRLQSGVGFMLGAPSDAQCRARRSQAVARGMTPVDGCTQAVMLPQ
jgi:hypothetical protein